MGEKAYRPAVTPLHTAPHSPVGQIYTCCPCHTLCPFPTTHPHTFPLPPTPTLPPHMHHPFTHTLHCQGHTPACSLTCPQDHCTEVRSACQFTALPVPALPLVLLCLPPTALYSATACPHCRDYAFSPAPHSPTTPPHLFTITTGARTVVVVVRGSQARWAGRWAPWWAVGDVCPHCYSAAPCMPHCCCSHPGVRHGKGELDHPTHPCHSLVPFMQFTYPFSWLVLDDPTLHYLAHRTPRFVTHLVPTHDCHLPFDLKHPMLLVTPATCLVTILTFSPTTHRWGRPCDACRGRKGDARTNSATLFSFDMTF